MEINVHINLLFFLGKKKKKWLLCIIIAPRVTPHDTLSLELFGKPIGTTNYQDIVGRATILTIQPYYHDFCILESMSQN